jgi:hypothetical protein
MHRPLAPLTAMLACAALLAAGAASAQNASHVASVTSPGTSLYFDWVSGWTPVSQEAGDALRIALDPETGTWGMAPVDRALRVSGIVPPPLIIHHANGMIETILDPSIVDWMVVRLGSDGRPVFECTSGEGRQPILSAPAVAGAPDR